MTLSIEKYKEIFELYYQGLCYYASGYISNGESVEDIVQDVFIAMWERKEKLTKINNIKAFLYTSVRNSCLNIQKHQQVKNSYDQYLLHSQTLTIDPEIVEEEVYIKLYNEIEKLPPSCRNIMLLSLEGLKNKEISEMLDISINTIKTQKKLALSKLRSKIDSFREVMAIFL